MCQNAFDSAKALLWSAPVLAAPRFEPFKLHTEASDVGVGAVLLQENAEGVDCPVSLPRKFNNHPYNYSVTEKGALALVWALQHF